MNEEKNFLKENIENKDYSEKGTLSFITGSLTSFLLCTFS